MTTEHVGPNIVHILDELERINILISANIVHIFEKKEVQTVQNKNEPLNVAPLKNLNIEDVNTNLSSISQETNNANTLPEQPFGIPLWATKKFQYPGVEEEIATFRSKINVKIANSHKASENLRLLRLKQLFKLSPEEFDIFLICLIGEFDTYYQVMWSDLQNNRNTRYPTIEIVLNILSSTLIEKLKLKHYLRNESNLFKYCLLECVDNSDSGLVGLTLHNTIRVSPRILNYLLENDAIPPILSNILEFSTQKKIINNLHLPADLNNQINAFVSTYHTLAAFDNQSIITLRGKEGVGRQMIAESICNTLRINMLVINIDNLLSNSLKELPSIFAMIRREAMLQNSAIFWRNIHLLSTNNENSNNKANILSLVTKHLKEFPVLHFFAMKPCEHFAVCQIKSTLMNLEIPALTTSERVKTWQDAIPMLPLADIIEITQSFQLGRGQIYDIAHHLHALFRDDKVPLSKEEVYKICHAQAQQHLTTYAKIIKPLYKLENIILPLECKQELEEIIGWIKYKDIVYEQSGFNKKVSLGTGLIALFFGSPGTGKTMAAEVIANGLNLLLYKIDLSSVLSKYVGETEQHLDKVFHEAENSNAILFFDEADSLFGKRGEVKDARDNYANIQTSYLLQKVEEYTGIVILATNYKNNMDEAFIRRLHFAVDFPFPQADQRRQIWKQIWPQDIQLDTKIDLQKLADKLELTGGSIRNIALTTAFKAANEQIAKIIPISITKDHLIFAIKREFKKMGRIILNEQLNYIFDTPGDLR